MAAARWWLAARFAAAVLVFSACWVVVSFFVAGLPLPAVPATDLRALFLPPSPGGVACPESMFLYSPSRY
jgi:hypothetical protein